MIKVLSYDKDSQEAWVSIQICGIDVECFYYPCLELPNINSDFTVTPLLVDRIYKSDKNESIVEKIDSNTYRFVGKVIKLDNKQCRADISINGVIMTDIDDVPGDIKLGDYIEIFVNNRLDITIKNWFQC